MSKLKEMLTQPLFKNESTRAGVQVVAGGYVIYLAYSMVKDALAGDTSVSMTTVWIMAAILGLGGLAIVITSGIKYYKAYQQEQAALAAIDEPEETEENQDQE